MKAVERNTKGKIVSETWQSEPKPGGNLRPAPAHGVVHLVVAHPVPVQVQVGVVLHLLGVDGGHPVNDTVGRGGAEQAFEPYLRGSSGVKAVERNTKGNRSRLV